MAPAPPHISVIIPVRNEALHIQSVLDAILAQDYDRERFEILVMDGLSEDSTKAIVQGYVEKYSNVRIFDNPKRLSSAARNIGLENAKGDIILLVDGHCLIDNPRMLAEVDKMFRETGADCLGRPQPLELKDADSMQLAIAAARRSRIGHHPDSFIYSDQPQPCPAISVAVAYRKSVFDRIGRFDERFDACEDAELNYRIDKAGLKCYFTPSIAVRYVPRGTLSGLFRQLTRYGIGRSRVAKKHPETFSWKSYLPALFVFCLIIGLPLGLLFPLTAGLEMGPVFRTVTFIPFVIYWGVVVFYLAIILAESTRIAITSKKLSYLWALPTVFMVIHLASGWGVLKETLFPNFPPEKR